MTSYSSDDASASLRRRARARVTAQEPSPDEAPRSPPEDQALIAELRIHQAELEIQNEDLRDAQLELARAHERFVDLYDFAPVGYITLSADGVIAEANLTAARLFGVDRARLIGTVLHRHVARRDEPVYLAYRQQLLDNPGEATCEVAMIRGDGSGFQAHLQSAPTAPDATVPGPFRVVVTDISARKAAERGWRQADTVIESAKEGVFIVDRQRRIARINPAFMTITGFEWSDVAEQPLDILLCERTDTAKFKAIWRALRKHWHWEGELRLRRRDGEAFPARLSLVALADEGGHITEYAGLFADITREKRVDRQLRQRAYYDSVTGLPNRALFGERLALAIGEARRHHHLVSLLYLDIDRFKEVNDRFGHNVGDQLLEVVAERLRAAVRDHDTVARIGGDEFAILLADIDRHQHIATVAEKVVEALATPARIADIDVHCRASIGIAVYPVDTTDPDTLLRYADLAMFRSKHSGRPDYQFFKDSMTRDAQTHARLSRELGHALQADEFRVHYQPIVDGRSGRIVGLEALLRWAHPERGLLHPDDFLSIAEDTGQIKGIGAWVLERVAGDCAAWIHAEPGMTVPYLSLNLSPRQFLYPDAFAETLAQLGSSGLPPGRVVLEVTEGVAIDRPDEAKRNLEALKAQGFRLAIDDFGTGYSSLAYLNRLPFDIVKIDRMFLQGIHSDTSPAYLVRAIIAMSQGLGLTCVAEGVETAAELEFLRECGCDCMQGHLIQPPVPADRLPALLERGVLQGDAADGDV